jgi:trk system potassium uptake protein
MSVQRPIRRRLMGSYNMDLRSPPRAKKTGSGALNVVAGFAIVLLAGTVLLTLPFSTERQGLGDVYESFFTAVSAICVTGLVVVETSQHWTFWGELWIALLIQIGGLGYMMGTSVVFWMLGQRLGVRDQYFMRLYYGAPTFAETFVFARRIALFAFVVEATGALLLYLAFVRAGVGWDTSVWWSIFHSISAFNNAGFAVTGNDMIVFRNDPFVLLTISSLVIIGGIGAVPILAILRLRSFHRLSLDSKIIFATTGVLILTGFVFYLVVEGGNDQTLATTPVAERPVVALFQSAVPRTAGFSAIHIEDLHEETKWFTVGLMFIGGAAGSTAGGIKVGTFTILLFALWSSARGRERVVAFGRQIPQKVILQALTIALIAVAGVFFASLVLIRVSEFREIDVLFEMVSALGTVGLTTGLSMEADNLGRAVLIVGMLLGRFGPLLLVLEMNRPRQRSTFQLPEDSIRMG